MASEAPIPINIFNEDEDLLEDDDAGDSDNDSESSAAAAAAAQVTIAVPGVSDLHLNHYHPPPMEREIIVAKKPAQLDESRKLFQRLWTDEDEIELLQGFLDYTTQRGGGPHNPSHHHDTSAFYDQIRSKFQLDFNKNQLVEKLRRLKKKYRNVINKFGSGKDYTFKSPHDRATFEISSRIWGNIASCGNVNGSFSAFRPAPIEEDDVDPNNPDCQSPNPNDIDMNSKFPRPMKRNRVGSVKVEDKQQSHTINSNANNNQQPEPVTPIGVGMTGSISGVIEETVKSCLSPIFKELLANSVNSNPITNGSCYGHGSSSALSPIPLGFGVIGGDKLGDIRWRKQQILELEVFSKRLELMQDEINEKLQELRSMGN